MFELALQTLLTPEQFTLLAACLLAGLSVALAVAGVLKMFGVLSGENGSEMPLELSAELRREFNRVLVTRGVKTSAGGVLGVATALIPLVLPISRRLPLDGLRRSYSEQYARAGWPGGLEDDELPAIALVLGVGIACVLGAFGALLQGPPGLIVAALVGFATGPMLVSASLSGRVRERDKAITRTIPFVLDLLVLTMRAGASLQIALRQVCEDYRGHPIGVEFAATLADIERGSTARQAFVNFASRAPVPIVKYLVDEIVQSDELGRPIATTLERLADQTRVRRVQDATSTAGAAKVAVLAPGVLILFAVLIVLLAPFGLKILFANEAPTL